MEETYILASMDRISRKRRSSLDLPKSSTLYDTSLDSNMTKFRSKNFEITFDFSLFFCMTSLSAVVIDDRHGKNKVVLQPFIWNLFRAVLLIQRFRRRYRCHRRLESHPCLYSTDNRKQWKENRHKISRATCENEQRM